MIKLPRRFIWHYHKEEEIKKSYLSTGKKNGKHTSGNRRLGEKRNRTGNRLGESHRREISEKKNGLAGSRKASTFEGKRGENPDSKKHDELQRGVRSIKKREKREGECKKGYRTSRRRINGDTSVSVLHRVNTEVILLRIRPLPQGSRPLKGKTIKKEKENLKRVSMRNHLKDPGGLRISDGSGGNFGDLGGWEHAFS